ncbi:MAG: helix-turn-helix transcriptional regulator [Taibaiella sp.]|nr:helix-turn-helix transcriptional regulator [Taibaiella sp.]
MNGREVSPGQRLRKARRISGLRQKHVKSALNLNSVDIVSRWENDEQLPSLAHAMGLSRLYKISVYELFPNIDEENVASIGTWFTSLHTLGEDDS